ncbi:MAG: RNA methyltransferase, partial [Oscillospiraceae bacterium]|nr:RNA methyltransferase [Oscillospiraceae bacterium]
METIKSISNKRVKDLVSLTKNRRFREETGLFVVEGATLAVEAANSDYLIESVFYTESAYRGYRDEIDAAAAGARTIFLITDQIAKKASSLASPQGILTVLQIKGEAGLDALSGKRRVVVLDRVQDPGNLGAIARSALAFGFDGIAISPDSADRYSDKSLRASMGALLRCDVVVGKTDETISRLKADGFRVYAAAL